MTVISRSLLLAGTLLLPAALCAIPAIAQTSLDRSSILRSLGEVDAAAQQIDAQELIREVRQRVVTNAPADQGLPIFDRLNRLPQLTVEILFDFNRAEVRPQSYVTLGRIADALHHPVLARHTFLVVGHTDAVGGRQPNLELSQRRAEAIVEALTTTFDIAPSRLIAVGLGEEQLRDPANPGAQANRRVQLITVGRTR
jgi:OOP family OmpA-OmpF porin